MNHEPDPISPMEAGARFVGVLLLAAIAYLHLLDISHKVDEGIWYMVFLFGGLIVASVALAVTLVRSSPTTVRLAWSGAALVALGALGGYMVSRVIPLPGMADHQGDWFSLYGVLAAFAELGVIALAAYAMRDLTVRGVAHEPPPAFRIPVSSTATSAILALVLLPSQAFGHGGVDDEAPAAAAPAGNGGANAAGAAGADGAAAAESTPMVAAHGDPFLGTAELGITFLALAGLITWSGRSLVARTRMEPSEAY